MNISFYKNSLNPEQTKYLEKNYKSLEKFFDIKPSKKVTIIFLKSKKRMEKLWGANTDISAMIHDNDPYTIYIYHPNVFEKYTNKKISEYLPILSHEFAHTFVTEINPRCFSWMNEGICEYSVDKKMYANTFPRNNWKWCIEKNVFCNPNIDWIQFIKHDGYEIAFNLTKYIIEKFNKKTFFQLLSIYRDESITDYHEIFSKTLEFDFQKLLTDFEKTLRLK